jgi:hypothetical protein
MKKLLLVLTTCLFLFGTIGKANAVSIVDTGAGYQANGAWTLASNQWLAGKFTIAEDFTINTVNGFMWGSTAGDRATAVIYSGDNSTPGTELYSSTFATSVADADKNTGKWYGASSLGWYLGTGTYWVSFEVRAGDTCSGAMLGGAPNPLNYEAYTNGGIWKAGDLHIGVQIFGDAGRVSPVPEPATLFLLGSGLLGLIGLKRWRKA